MQYSRTSQKLFWAKIEENLSFTNHLRKWISLTGGQNIICLEVKVFSSGNEFVLVRGSWTNNRNPDFFPCDLVLLAKLNLRGLTLAGQKEKFHRQSLIQSRILVSSGGFLNSPFTSKACNYKSFKLHSFISRPKKRNDVKFQIRFPLDWVKQIAYTEKQILRAFFLCSILNGD